MSIYVYNGNIVEHQQLYDYMDIYYCLQNIVDEQICAVKS